VIGGLVIIRANAVSAEPNSNITMDIAVIPTPITRMAIILTPMVVFVCFNLQDRFFPFKFFSIDTDIGYQRFKPFSTLNLMIYYDCIINSS
jgi:hypothetical protein